MRNKSDEILLGYTSRSTNDAIKKSFKDPTYETQISWLRHAQNHAHDFSRINETESKNTNVRESPFFLTTSPSDILKWV